MSERKPMTPEVEAEVKQWLHRLLTGAGGPRREAAAELSRLGVWTRGSVRTRGSLGRSAPNRLPEPDRLGEVVACLGDADGEVRRQVALALGEWGDEAAAAALCRLLQADADEEVQLYCVTALRMIGGPTAAEGLRRAAGRGTEAVRHAALTAIE